MSKLARALALAAMVAAMSLAGMTALAQAQPGGHDPRRPTTSRQAGEARPERRATSPAQAAADAAHRRLLAQERSYSTWSYGDTTAPAPAKPGGPAGWVIPALGALAAVGALVAGVAVLTARRATRGQRTEQTA